MIDQESIHILEMLIEQRRRARQWEHGFKTLDDLNTSLNAPAMQTLLKDGLVQYYRTTTNPNIPDDVVRIAAGRIDDVEAIIACYVATLASAIGRPTLNSA